MTLDQWLLLSLNLLGLAHLGLRTWTLRHAHVQAVKTNLGRVR
jgi:hypothetical protein